MCLELCTNVEDLEDVSGSWMQPGSALAIAAIWEFKITKLGLCFYSEESNSLFNIQLEQSLSGT